MASLIVQFVILRIVNFLRESRDLFTALNKAATSYLVKIKAFNVALLQYTADEQDSCSALAPEAQPWRDNGSENGWRHAVSNFTCCIYPQLLATVSFNFTTGIQMSSLTFRA